MWLNIILAALIPQNNTKGQDSVHKSLPLQPNLSQINSIYVYKFQSFKIHFNITHLFISCVVSYIWVLLTKILCAFLIPHVCYIQAYPITMNQVSWKKQWSSSICNFLQAPVTSTLSDSHTWPVTLNQCFSLTMTEQILHSHKTTFTNKVLHTFIFLIPDSTEEKIMKIMVIKYLSSLTCSKFLNEQSFRLIHVLKTTFLQIFY